MGLIILILVILLLVGAFPTRGYGFGYRSHGIIGTIGYRLIHGQFHAFLLKRG
jgi:Protein of unknown function (DUF3309)